MVLVCPDLCINYELMGSTHMHEKAALHQALCLGLGAQWEKHTTLQGRQGLFVTADFSWTFVPIFVVLHFIFIDPYWTNGFLPFIALISSASQVLCQDKSDHKPALRCIRGATLCVNPIVSPFVQRRISNGSASGHTVPTETLKCTHV